MATIKKGTLKKYNMEHLAREAVYDFQHDTEDESAAIENLLDLLGQRNLVSDQYMTSLICWMLNGHLWLELDKEGNLKIKRY